MWSTGPQAGFHCSFAVLIGSPIRRKLENLPSWSVEASKDAFPFVSIIHLGFGQNRFVLFSSGNTDDIFRLQSPLTDYYISKSFFPNLRSIDLSENNLTDLESFISYARKVFEFQH